MSKTGSYPIRIGHGFDVHRFGEGDHLMLGGIRIPYEKGLVAHSDGDVLIHAVCDALLGAIAKGDIGRHFPDTDPAYNNIDSADLLTNVYTQVKNAGYSLGNLDVTVVAQAPVLSKHIPSMCQRLADILDASINQINVKATTTEKLGYIGRKEGIAVHAVVTLYKSSD